MQEAIFVLSDQSQDRQQQMGRERAAVKLLPGCYPLLFGIGDEGMNVGQGAFVLAQ